MKKSFSIIVLIMTLLACDLSTSVVPTEKVDDMAATVNAIMTEFPTIESMPTAKPTSQPTLLAPIPSLQTTGSDIGGLPPTGGTTEPTSSAGTKQTPSGTEAASPTATITPTFAVDDPRSVLGPYSWVDTYANGNNWPQGSDKYTSIQFVNGTMQLTALTDKDGWRLTYPTISNFYLEASFQTANCMKTDHFGMIFRVPDINAANQGYFFGIQCDGKYYLKVFAEDVMTSIVYPKANSAIRIDQDAVNRLGVMAEQDKLSLYINGILVREVNDTHFPRGGFGIFVGSDVVPNFTVIVDEIAYWTLP
jgi:hypothetical protein